MPLFSTLPSCYSQIYRVNLSENILMSAGKSKF